MGSGVSGIPYEAVRAWLRDHVPVEEWRMTDRWVTAMDSAFMEHQAEQMRRSSAQSRQRGRGMSGGLTYES